MSGPAPGFNIVTTPILDTSGKMPFAWIKWFQAAQLQLQAAFNQLGQLTGQITPQATVVGRAGTLADAIQNLNSSGELASSALTGFISPAQIPVATTSTIGGIQANNPTAHEWVNSINASGVPQLSQPGFSDLSGSAAAGQIPPLSSLSGSVTPAQCPVLSALNGQITTSQLPPGGQSVTVPLAKLTVGGTNGSLTFVDGQLTSSVAPT